MNPSYTVFIDVQLTKLIDGEEIYMRLVTRLPYVPRMGEAIILTADDDETTIELDLDKVTYNTREGTFVVDIEDATMVNNYREGGTLQEQEVVDKYKAFGFTRLNFPQGEGRQ